MSDADFLRTIQPIEMGLYTAVRAKYGYSFNATTAKGSENFLRGMQSYWLFEEFGGATELADAYVAGSTAIISVGYDNYNQGAVGELVDYLEKTVRSLVKEQGSGSVSFGLTGLSPFATAILDGVAEDLHFMDSAVLPLALLILATIIKSLTLMVIPILNIFVTIVRKYEPLIARGGRGRVGAEKGPHLVAAVALR